MSTRSDFLLHPAMHRLSAYHLQDPRKPKAECRTCKKPYIGTPTQKDCDACRKNKR